MAESRPIRLLALLDEGGAHRYAEAAAPMLRQLSIHPQLEVRVGGRPAGGDVVLLAQERPPDPGLAADLAAHVRSGGGLLTLHGTLAAWAQEPTLASIAGWVPGPAAPEAELRVVCLPGNPLTDRLEPELLFRDRLLVSDPPPESALPLLVAPWHYRQVPLAFELKVGQGRLVQLSLGGPSAWEQPVFARLLYRAIRQAAGVGSAPPVGVGLLGYGAIGREHASAVVATAGLELRSVCDRSSERREQAASAFGVSTVDEGRTLLADPGVDLVVIGVPPAAHVDAVLEALAAGKNVVCEKPFALTVAECDRMLEAAAAAGRALTVYQSRRWDPDFVALREAVNSGTIGEPFYMESFIGGFSHPCSYWHSHEPVSGGTIFDWGSHYFDWMLQLFAGEVVSVAASSQKRVWHDVTNSDHVRVDVTFEGGAQASFLQSEIAAALKPKWYLLGTAGAITGDWRSEVIKARAWTGDLIEEPLSPAEAPALLTIHRPDGQGRTHREVRALPARVRDGFYRNLADHLLTGEPLAVRPEEARRNVAVMEAAARAIASGRSVEVRA